MINKYSVLTFIINDYEYVREIEYDISTTPHIEYILVTDNPNLKSNTWNIIYDKDLEDSNLTVYDKVMMVRYNPYKYVSNDICVRIDGSMQIVKPLDYFINEFIEGEYDGSLLLHPLRDLIYDEYRAWHLLRNMPWEEIYEHYNYINDLFNYDYNTKGLYQTGFSIIKNNYMYNVINKTMLEILKIENGHCTKLDQTFFSCFINTHFYNRKWMFFTDEIFNGEYLKMFCHNSDKLVNEKHYNDFIFRDNYVKPIY